MSQTIGQPIVPLAYASNLSPAVQQELEQLRDIHLPEPVSWFPMAIGWWLLIGLLLIALFFAFRKWQAHRCLFNHPAYRSALEALSLLPQQSGKDPAKLAGGLSALLKRVGIYLQQPIAALSGDEWANYLQQDSTNEDVDKSSFNKQQADFIAHGAYANYDQQTSKSQPIPDWQSLELAAQTWITAQFRQALAQPKNKRNRQERL